MKLAYVDTSALVAIAFGEPGWQKTGRALREPDHLFSSNLLEAELRASFLREEVDEPVEELLSWIEWILPDRPLSAECERVLASGYQRGADVWHLACGLYLQERLDAQLAFLSLDERQLNAAGRLGFLQVSGPE